MSTAHTFRHLARLIRSQWLNWLMDMGGFGFRLLLIPLVGLVLRGFFSLPSRCFWARKSTQNLSARRARTPPSATTSLPAHGARSSPTLWVMPRRRAAGDGRSGTFPRFSEEWPGRGQRERHSGRGQVAATAT